MQESQLEKKVLFLPGGCNSKVHHKATQKSCASIGYGSIASSGRAGDMELTAAVTLQPQQLQWAAQTGLKAEGRGSLCCR